MLPVLFIEDQQEVLEPVTRLLGRERPNITCTISSFEEAEKKIIELQPRIIVLDLMKDGTTAEPDNAGLRTREFIWGKYFCPIIIYSARPELHDDTCDEHPFVKSVKKGAKSPRLVLETIDAFAQHVTALAETENYVRRALSEVMRNTAPYAFESRADDASRIEVIKRSGRRRLAAMMDNFDSPDSKLAPWEQYIFPPVTSSAKLGDVLWVRGKAKTDPTSYRIILTPSCDLALSPTRTPKVGFVLVAKCFGIRSGLDFTSMNGMKPAKLQERLSGSMLTHGFFETVIPLPELKGTIPPMMASLRHLDLISVSEIGSAEKPFERIASIDSPFREAISWAYMQSSGRPGLPDRDNVAWTTEIIENL